jgi:flagellar hook-associated protein 1
MPLSTALNIAQNSLLSVTRRTGMVARNVAEAGNSGYARRIALQESTAPGARISGFRRAVDAELARANRQALSDSSAQTTLADGIDQLHAALNGADGSLSHATFLTELHNRIQTWSASPSDPLLASAVLGGAKQLAANIRDAATAILDFRAQADGEIASSVEKLNGYLAEFEEVNGEIVNGTLGGADVNDALDRRDVLVKSIAEIVPVSTITRTGDDMMLITAGGATLFETVARTVTFTSTPAFAAGSSGNAVRVDGIPLSLDKGSRSSASGSISALLQLRDEAAVHVLGQLDEVARGLVETFAERGPAASPAAPLAGLFAFSGGPGLPASGTIYPGMAATLTINAAFDTERGGNIMLLRDGGANGAAYVENTDGAASFADRLLGLAKGIDTAMAFDAQSGVGGNLSLLRFSAQSVGWLDGYRSETSAAADAKEALSQRLSEKLSNATGVNIDEEMSQLVELEHSYEASARLIKVIDDMLANLFAAVR